MGLLQDLTLKTDLQILLTQPQISCNKDIPKNLQKLFSEGSQYEYAKKNLAAKET